MRGDVAAPEHNDTHQHASITVHARSRAPPPMQARTACVRTSPACWRCTHTTTHDSHTTYGDVTAPHRAAPTLQPPPPSTHVHAPHRPCTHAQHQLARRHHAVTTLRHVGTYPALSTALHARSRSPLPTRAMHGDVTTSTQRGMPTATPTRHVSITAHARSRAPPPMHARTACMCTSPACWRCTHTTTHRR
jgi:hypothetical protein